MDMGYTKLFSSIVTSTIWVETDRTRIVWITMLAICDKNGEVQASIPGLARLAGVPIEDCEQALDKFLAPDPYSRTPDDKGRRIEKIEGGWALLNHAKYRNMASKEESKNAAGERQKRYRERVKRNACVMVGNATVTHGRDIADTEAEAEADKKYNTPLPPKRGNGEKGPIQLRAEAIFKRRPETPLTVSEVRAFKNNRAALEATNESDWQLLERFYALPQEKTKTRKNLDTLLNNWNGEIDRAKSYFGGGQTTNEPALKFI